MVGVEAASASSTTSMKSRISPCFAGKPVGRGTDLEKIERLVVAWAAGTVVSALGHLIDQLLIIFLAAGISGTFSPHTRTSVGFAVMAAKPCQSAPRRSVIRSARVGRAPHRYPRKHQSARKTRRCAHAGDRGGGQQGATTPRVRRKPERPPSPWVISTVSQRPEAIAAAAWRTWIMNKQPPIDPFGG